MNLGRQNVSHGALVVGKLLEGVTTPAPLGSINPPAPGLDWDALKIPAGTPDGYALTVSAAAAEGVVWAAQTGSGGDLTAAYVIQVADSNLANAQVLASLGTGVLKSTTGTGVLSIAGGADLPVFTRSGTGHHGGAVPDPGASAATTHFLREDASWAIPPGTYTLPSALTGATLVVTGSIATNGVATPPAQAALPTTLADVIAILVSLGFCASS